MAFGGEMEALLEFYGSRVDAPLEDNLSIPAAARGHTTSHVDCIMDSTYSAYPQSADPEDELSWQPCPGIPDET